MYIFLIRSLLLSDTENGNALWWSPERTYGDVTGGASPVSVIVEGCWTTIEKAGVFTQTACETVDLPPNGEWVEFYHDLFSQV